MQRYTVSRYKLCNVASCLIHIRILLWCTDPWTLISTSTLWCSSIVYTHMQLTIILFTETPPNLAQFKAIHRCYRFCKIHRHLVLIKPRHTCSRGVQVYICNQIHAESFVLNMYIFRKFKKQWIICWYDRNIIP
jgi:hypothetical protein